MVVDARTFETAQNIITNAIRSDFSADSLTIGEHSDFILQHDPLGQAFYTYAMLETGYASLTLETLPQQWSLWVEEKLSGADLGVHLNMELAALGLILFALVNRYEPPGNSDKFVVLAEKHFSFNKGIYSDFMATVLVGLGLSQIAATSEVFLKLKEYVQSQLDHNRQEVFNDSKNLVVIYWWSKAIGAKALRESLRNECWNRVQTKQYLLRDQVYIAYVLLEEIKELPRTSRTEVKRLIENSLAFVRDYTRETEYSADLLEEYGTDVALADGEEQTQEFDAFKPRLSRILLAVALLIGRKYVQKQTALHSWEQRRNTFVKGAGYALCLSLIAFLTFYFGVEWFDLPIKPSKLFGGEKAQSVLLRCLVVILNTIWITVPLYLITAAGKVAHITFWKGLTDDFEILKRGFVYGWEKFGGGAALFALLISVYVEIVASHE